MKSGLAVWIVLANCLALFAPSVNAPAREIDDLLPSAQAVAWQASPLLLSERGPLLLQFLAEDRQLRPLLDQATPPEELDPALGPLAPSVRLAVAEQHLFKQQFDALAAWLEGVDRKATYSPTLVDYLRAVRSVVLVDSEKSETLLKRLEDERNALGPARQAMVQQLRTQQTGLSSHKLVEAKQRMRDVERRLALGQPEQPTQEQQENVLKLLEDLIKQAEQESQRQAAQAKASGNAPTQPADESRPSSLKGEGLADSKRFAAGDPWGALSPAERERITQQLGTNQPPHYQQLIRQYYERLAEGDTQQTLPNSQPEEEQ